MDCFRLENQRWIRRTALCLAMGAGLFFTSIVDGLAAADDNSLESAARLALVERVAEKGDLPVIMRLKVDAVPEAMLRSPAAVAAQKAGISNIGRRVIQALRSYRVKRVKRFKHIPYVAATLDAAGMEAAMHDPDIVQIYEDKLSWPTLAQSTPLIGATAALAAGYGGSGQVIAVLDTGVDKSHPFLGRKVVHEACFSSNVALYDASSLCPNGQNTQLGAGTGAACDNIDGCDHGTHVAGIAAGSGSSFSGVAPDADLMAIQVFSRFDNAQDCFFQAPCVLSFTSDQISALEYVYEQRGAYNIAAVNMSLGGGSYATACDDEPAKAAIDLLRTAGIATVIAAGNDGFTSSIGAPACISSAISVGSTTEADAVSSFSNSAQILDLLAPGSDITSSVPGGAYTTFNGTSMATPHVAGAFAVLRSKLRAASVDLMLSALKTTGLSVTDARNGLIKSRVRLRDALDALDASEEGRLSVAPASGYSVSGVAGGPFSPASIAYTVTNKGTSPIDFSVAENAAWVDVAPGGGTLAAGANMRVTAAVNAGANSLEVGDYVSSISFENLTNGIGSTHRPLSLVVTHPAALNDKFADGIPLLRSSGSTVGNNFTATRESGEPLHADFGGERSVWWRWVATSSGEFTIDTVGSDFDTVLAGYTGNNVAALAIVAANDDAVELQSQINFQVQAGVEYRIVVDGYAAASGNIVLNWNFTQTTTPDTPIEVIPSAGFSASGVAGGPFTPNSISYTLTNNSSSTKTVQIQGVPDWLMVNIGTNTLVPAVSTTVALTINSAVADQLPAGGYSSVVSFSGVGRVVSLLVSSEDETNDNLGDAVLLRGAQVSVSGSNLEATKEVGEPNHAGISGGRSVWWRWVAPTSGATAIDTFGSNFDTILGVYSGTSFADLSTVASNDDAPSVGMQSVVEFSSVAGMTYLIAVDGYFGAVGLVKVNIRHDFNAGVLVPIIQLLLDE